MYALINWSNFMTEEFNAEAMTELIKERDELKRDLAIYVKATDWAAKTLTWLADNESKGVLQLAISI
jgi:hypothetical protein